MPEVPLLQPGPQLDHESEDRSTGGRLDHESEAALAKQIRRTEAAEAEAMRLQEVEAALLEQTKKLATLLEKANATIRGFDPVLAVSCVIPIALRARSLQTG